MNEYANIHCALTSRGRNSIYLSHMSKGQNCIHAKRKSLKNILKCLRSRRRNRRRNHILLIRNLSKKCFRNHHLSLRSWQFWRQTQNKVPSLKTPYSESMRLFDCILLNNRSSIHIIDLNNKN